MPIATCSLVACFCLGLGAGQNFFEHDSLPLQELAEGFKGKSKIPEAFICFIESIQRQKSFCRRISVAFQDGS
jgi:hypothetical protein